MDAQSLSSTSEDAMRTPGVLGVAVVDAQGLCLHSQGAVPTACGSIAELATHAYRLSGNQDDAIVSVVSAQQKVLISSSGGVTTALFMQPDSANTS
eukprot:CAMPEP_0119336568 /NCGR_PEP_ID=MMETSP1333-20130426/92106_1 /TAXON_ID=418940 /ORGANISM="Scyphosphaera apsteinii, Strain RCC1455" /LENGTH=95 /DNA_ID=CAMNT_0007347391 /DNA_START=49 /DNA_END=336 /DNA_ORIENTATION=+